MMKHGFKKMLTTALALALLLLPMSGLATELTAEAKGFASTVKVVLTLDETGAIATLTVDASGETPNLGTKCADEAFTSQFIGKKGPFALNIDGVSGATVSSQAVVDALNAILPSTSIPGARLNSTAKGFGGDVKITVTMGKNGTIAALKVDASNETLGLGTLVSEEAFTSQFIGKTGPFYLGIDAVSGATVTSQAVVDAINAALAAAAAEEPAKAEPFVNPKECDFRIDYSVDAVEDGKNCEFKME